MDSSGVWVGSNFLVIRSYLNHRLRWSKEIPHVLFTHIELIIYIYIVDIDNYMYTYCLQYHITYGIECLHYYIILHTHNICIYT
jgi:hypothetical protein